jgi:ribosomal protein S18 acetylase RimI-like enzyme
MTEVLLRAGTADDLPAICALVNRSEAHDGVPRALELDDLRDELDDERVRLDSDVRVAVVDGGVVGYVYTFHLPSEVVEERCYLFGSVDPRARGAGIGSALLQWGIGRATEQLRSSGRTLPRYIRVDGYDYLASAHRLYARHGFTAVRYFEELLRPLDDVPAAPTVEGVRIVPWPADRDEETRVAKNLSFRDHWGSAPTSPADWHRMVRGYGARPDLSFVALDADDRVVGHCVNHRYEADDARIGRRDGWIESLGTLREWRGRGLGSAMVAASLRAFASADLTHASIGVDSANPSGAARLYRDLGFEPRQRSITHQIVVG